MGQKIALSHAVWADGHSLYLIGFEDLAENDKTGEKGVNSLRGHLQNVPQSVPVPLFQPVIKGLDLLGGEGNSGRKTIELANGPYSPAYADQMRAGEMLHR
jgi:hypothetical protein